MADISTRIAENLQAVRERITQAARESGRDPASVQLIAVSKFHPPAALREAYAAGQRHFGENYAQELADKARELSDLTDLSLHFIGGLQRNKLKLLLDAGAAIETLASEAHARSLHERASAAGQSCEVLIQVNVLGETQKGGVAPDDLARLVERVRGFSSLLLRGLMTIPQADDLALSERAYRTLAELARAHALSELSMGMSDDLEVAVREGATRVRIGTAIFGPRPG